jgi:hypothetical protein
MPCGRRPRRLADAGLNFAFTGISFVLVRLSGKDGCFRHTQDEKDQVAAVGLNVV